jgi:uncharacterized membrane-anchored protein
MHALILRKVRQSQTNLFSLFFAVFCLSSAMTSNCLAQQSSLAPIIGSTSKYTPGPTTVPLGDAADIQVPQGFSILTDADEMRQMFENAKRPVPSGLAGILKAPSGAWLVVFTYHDIGYVKTSAHETIDSNKILDIYSDQLQAATRNIPANEPHGESLAWWLAPQFDKADHSVEFAYLIEGNNYRNVRHVFIGLTRRGYFTAEIEQRVQSSSEMISLTKFIGQIVALKQGQRYADYQAGDKLSYLSSVSEILTGNRRVGPAPQQTWFANVRTWFITLNHRQMIWISCGAAVCVLSIVGFLVTREIRSLKQHKSFEAHPHTNGKFFANGHAFARNASRRKRTFDYQKFYADMMTQVSCRSGGPSPDAVSIVNGHETRVEARDAKALQTINELIAQQKDFIEEQRRLMQQQARLIEERSRLIEEKNQLLAKQAEMMEPHLL